MEPHVNNMAAAGKNLKSQMKIVFINVISKVIEPNLMADALWI